MKDQQTGAVIKNKRFRNYDIQPKRRLSVSELFLACKLCLFKFHLYLVPGQYVQ